MAILKLSAFITQISGKIAGSQFANTPSGVVVKNIGTRSKKLFPKVASNLNVFANTAQSWRLLTDTQRADWNAATVNFPYINRLGESKVYSGFNLFVKLNGSLRTIDLPIVQDAPAPHTFVDTVINSVSISVGTLIFNVGQVDDECIYILKGALILNGGATSTSGDTTIFDVIPGVDFLGIFGLVLNNYPIFNNANLNSQILLSIDCVFEGTGQSQRQIFVGLINVF